MTNIFDNLHIGAAPTGIGAQTSGGFGFGPIGRIYIYDIVPLALNAAAYAASQSPGSAKAVTLSAGTGVTKSTYQGLTIYSADVPRAVTITSGADESANTITIKGFDTYGAAMTQSLAGGATGTVTTTKAFKSIYSVTSSANFSGTITVGTADVFGFPVAVVDAGYIIHAGWAETLADNAGTFVAAVATTASATTGDVRGTYAQAGAASNGTRRLVVSIALSDLNIGGDTQTTNSQTVVGVLGVTQF
jgi:hypothetical protein